MFFAVRWHSWLAILERCLALELAVEDCLFEQSLLIIGEHIKLLALATEVKVEEELGDQGILLGGSLLECLIELLNASHVLQGASHLQTLFHKVSEALVSVSLSFEGVQVFEKLGSFRFLAGWSQ